MDAQRHGRCDWSPVDIDLRRRQPDLQRCANVNEKLCKRLVGCQNAQFDEFALPIHKVALKEHLAKNEPSQNILKIGGGNIKHRFFIPKQVGILLFGPFDPVY